VPTNSEVWFHYSLNRDREQVKRDLVVARPTLNALEKMLESKVKRLTEKDYDKASWAYWRADVDGYNRALEEVRSLIKEGH